MGSLVLVPSDKVLAECVRSATSAPSLHNSQPWRFVIIGNTVEVYADPDRRLLVLDPAGREQLISVGAALFTLRLAVSRAGFASRTRLFPSPDEPDLVARLTVKGRAPVSSSAQALAAAIPHRHTNRWAFTAAPVPEAVLNSLRDAAQRERAVLTVAAPPARAAILGLARSADRWLRARPGYGTELARWTATGQDRDGVPPWATGVADVRGTMPLRDFAEASVAPRPVETFEPQPTILALATAGDRPADWVRAGQALQRVLLSATCQQLAAMPISQLVEVPAVRNVLSNAAGGLSVQMVLRVGYGAARAGTPRRPLAEVLTTRRAPAEAQPRAARGTRRARAAAR
ncbi:Acg family FMN-binding oxidoreductase [Paractinoplanes hotanensis]|uniref:Nitroreductase family protein n=1 Tax=Paractinoplanes hotanensis TaxID=2906497 RepID=A0ABT0YFU2_9ACTN|nr:nitroreductase family protein [Actinoplanes hotanensis]MCM4084377.1 nitroreductase family protein [Actinoplanes hotanensis]